MGVLITGELHFCYLRTYTVNLFSVWMVLQLSMTRCYHDSPMIFTISHGMVNGYSVTHHTEPPRVSWRVFYL